MLGEYPYWGPTGVLDWINEYRYDGSYCLIGEDGDHFLKFQNWPMTQWATGRFNVNNHAHVIASGPHCSARWFYFFFRHRDVGGALIAQGVSRLKLTRWSLSNLWMAVPPSSEQSPIVKNLNQVLLVEQTSAGAISGQLTKLAEYRQAIITAAVTGQINIEAAA
jgi:type I restriction enzyme S subunit